MNLLLKVGHLNLLGRVITSKGAGGLGKVENGGGIGRL